MSSEGSTVDSYGASSVELTDEDNKAIEGQLKELQEYINIDAAVKGVSNSVRLENYYKRLVQMEVLAIKCKSSSCLAKRSVELQMCRVWFLFVLSYRRSLILFLQSWTRGVTLSTL